MVEIKLGKTIYISFTSDSDIPTVNTTSNERRPGTDNPLIDFIINDSTLPESASRKDIWRAKRYAKEIVGSPQNYGEGKEGSEKLERAIRILGLF